MADGTHIQWTDATWQPITGYSVVSPGCTNCYAMRLAGTRLRHHPSRAGLTVDTRAGPVWNGEVRFNEDWLDQPLRWKRPRRIFVCAHGDLFHRGIPDEWIDKVFAVMALAPHHTFQVLTKRPEHMLDYLADRSMPGRLLNVAHALRTNSKFITAAMAEGYDAAFETYGGGNPHGSDYRPLPNVWLGVSVEDQERADERIPLLLDTPAAKRFISAEPLLGPIDLARLCVLPQKPGSVRAGVHIDALRNKHFESGLKRGLGPLNWVIVGGESGPGARPMHPNWARSLRDQCQAAGVAFHFKQWGALAPIGYPDGVTDPKEHLWIRVGKKAAGRLLDGRTWDEFPA